MNLWRRTIGVGLGLVAAGCLCTVAQAAPEQAEAVDAPRLVQVNEVPIEQAQIDEVLIDQIQTGQAQMDEIMGSLATPEVLAEVAPISTENLPNTVVEALAAEVTPVPTQVLESLSPRQIEAIAAIISTAEASTSPDRIANLPTEVLTRLDALPIVQQQVGRRRWLPTSLVRRLRLPQAIASLVRQPKNSALVMLGNHIVVVNPVTGAVLGAVLSAL